MKWNVLIIFVLLICILGIYSASRFNSQSDCGNYRIDQKSELISGHTFTIQKAVIEADRNKGLSGKKCIPENQAMLFVFDKPDTYGFWMKDMNFPIDMLWLDADKKVVFIQKNATPESYPKVFKPKEKSLYVLEVASGTADKLNVTVGTRLNF